MAPILYSKTGKVFVETTYRCYSGCPWCYQGCLVYSKAEHVPLEILKKRIKWLVDNTNCHTIGQIGGDPLLHPDFIQICDHIISLGKFVLITTSGKISNLPQEKENLEYALKLYAEGRLFINLSYQPGRNHNDYLYLLGRVMKLYKERRESGRKTGSWVDGNTDLFSMVAIDESFLDFLKLKDLVAFLIKASGYNPYPDDSPDLVFIKESVEKAYSCSSEEREGFAISMDPTLDDGNFRHSILLGDLSKVETVSDGSHKVTVLIGGICAAAKAKIQDDCIELPAIYIRVDGHLIWADPECITMKRGLCNIDIHTTPKDIYNVVKKSLNQILGHVFLANRRKALRNCDEAGKEKQCISCPKDDMCSACHSLERDWK